MANCVQIKAVSYWHQAIIDWELNNPEKTMNECARVFGVTAGWMSVIRKSDVFQEYAARRRQEHNEGVSKSITERVEELAGNAVEVLNERIIAERASIGLAVVNTSADMALKALGFGVRKGGDNPAVQVNVGLEVSPELLARARTKMRRVQSSQETEVPMLEGEVLEVQQ